MGIYGQDWAVYQTATPDTTGLDFAFVKVTEGLSYINPRWVQQRDHAKAAGLVWGAYHYPHMGNSVQAEADFFLSQVAWRPGDMLVLDWEGYDASNTAVSKATQAAFKDAWLKYVKAKMPNNPVGMYCNTDYWRHVDSTGFYGDFLWIATGGLPAGQPGITAPWLFHQYSASGGLDRDYCHLDSRDALRAWALSFQQEDDMTPAQAQQLQELHDMLTSIGSLTDKDAKGNPVMHGQGWYSAHTHYDTVTINAKVDALTKAVAAVQTQSASNGAQLTKALTALTAISTAVSAGGSADSIVAAVKAELEAWHPTVTITG